MLAPLNTRDELVVPSGLSSKLLRWAKDVPLYRGVSSSTNGNGSSAAPELSSFPFITKADIRRGFPWNFLPAGVELDDLLEQDLVEVEHTSGTSEERTALILGRGWWAEQEERALRQNALVSRVLDEFPDCLRVTISSPVCSGDICYTGVPALSERVVGNALHVNLSRLPFLWGRVDLRRMAEEAIDWAPQFLDVDPVYGVAFALYCEREGIHLPSLQFIIASYEFVSVVHRRILERVFGVRVFNLYGSTETGHLLMENERGEMRPSRDTAFLQVIESDGSASNGERSGPGDLIVTTLSNPYMPLIRYQIGDLVERVPGETDHYIVHGRAMDAAGVGPSCATVWEIDQCFATVAGIAHYQLVEREPNRWLLRFVPDRLPPSPEALSDLQNSLRELLPGCSELSLERSNVLMPESSGKFRLVYPRPQLGRS